MLKIKNFASVKSMLLSVIICSATLPVKASDVSANLLKLYQSRECRGCNLSRADLTNSDFSNVDLQGANLSETNLSGSKLDGANLSWTDLSRANLSHSSLVSARLTGARMYMTDLRNAIISGAELKLEQLVKANTLHIIGMESLYRDVNQFMAAGQAAIDDRKYQLAESLFTHVLESDRDMYKAWIGRSVSRLAMGKIEQAIHDLDKSREVAAEQGLEQEFIQATLAMEKLIALDKANYKQNDTGFKANPYSQNPAGGFAANVGSSLAGAAKIALPIMLKILTSGAL